MIGVTELLQVSIPVKTLSLETMLRTMRHPERCFAKQVAESEPTRRTVAEFARACMHLPFKLEHGLPRITQTLAALHTLIPFLAQHSMVPDLVCSPGTALQHILHGCCSAVPATHAPSPVIVHVELWCIEACDSWASAACIAQAFIEFCMQIATGQI
jgi:hypothetical protein